MPLLFRLDSRRYGAVASAVLGAVLVAQACTQNTDVEFGTLDGSVGSSGTTPTASGGPASSSGAPSGEGGSSGQTSGRPPPPECVAPTDCESGVCSPEGECLAPTSADGVKNGTETDIDCGGGAPTDAPRCALAAACVTHTDCASEGCAYTGTCIADRSCTQRQGGDTCGRGAEVDGQVDDNANCCARAPLAGSAVTIDRFLITAGRMRSFIEHLDGNVRAFVGTLPASRWSPSWNALVPSTIVEANDMLGPRWVGAPNDPDGAESKRACAAPFSNGHTYWIPKVPLNAGDPASSYDPEQQYTQEQLDAKALNCVGWHLVNAFCAWEGGRLPLHVETANAFTNNGANTYPWQFQDGSAYSPDVADGRLNHLYNYEMPNSVADALDITAKISPPGRFYRGWNANEVEVAGNLLQWAADAERNFSWTISFEHHVSVAAVDNWGTPTADRNPVPNGYYALGARCAYDP